MVEQCMTLAKRSLCFFFIIYRERVECPTLLHWVRMKLSPRQKALCCLFTRSGQGEVGEGDQRGEALTCMESPSPAQPSCCISHLPSSHLTLAKPDSSQSLNLPLSFPLRCCLHECAFPHILTCVLCNSTHFPSFLEDLS